MKRPGRKGLVRRFGKWARAAVTADLGLKALCLMLAIGLTAYQRGSRDEQQRTVPVAVIARLPTPEQQRELMTLVPPTVNLTVRGSTSAIELLIQSGVPPVELDLRDANTGKVVFEQSMFAMPPGVEVNFIDPASIELEWENIIRRPVPIQASMTGQVADGYVVKSTSVEPAMITLEGPANLVDVMQFVRLEAFDVSGKKEGVHRHILALDPPPARTQYVGPARARAAVTIERQLIQRKFPKQLLTVVGPPRAKTNPKYVDITITGSPEALEGLGPDLVIPRVEIEDIDLREMRHGSTVRPINVDLANVVVEVQPPTATVIW